MKRIKQTTLTITPDERKASALHTRFRNGLYWQQAIMPIVCMLFAVALCCFAVAGTDTWQTQRLLFCSLSFAVLGSRWFRRARENFLDVMDEWFAGVETISIDGSCIRQIIEGADGYRCIATTKLDDIDDYGFNKHTGRAWYTGTISVEITGADGKASVTEIDGISTFASYETGSAFVHAMRERVGEW